MDEDEIFDEFADEVTKSILKEIEGNSSELTNKVFLETVCFKCILQTSKDFKTKLLNNPYYGVKSENVDELIMAMAAEVNARLRKISLKNNIPA